MSAYLTVPLPSALRAELRKERQHLGWNRATLAEKSGVSARTIAYIESGDTQTVTLHSVEKIADAMGFDLVLVPKMDKEVT